MNSVVNVVALVLGLCSFCAKSTLVRGPADNSVLLGETVTLECVTANKGYPPAWSYQKVGSSEKTHISSVERSGDTIVPKFINGYGERHHFVGNREEGEYSLQITDVNPEDAGIYTCTAKGGLTEKRSAELSVFEPYPVCASNITDALGENDCHKEPDTIEFSCKFLVYGNYLPRITWFDVNHPEKAIVIDSPTKDATGMTSSKLIVKGNYFGLDETNFTCIIGSEGNAGDTRFHCLTPKINVIKISNLTESKTLIAPEEVECTGWSKLNASGCEWFRGGEDSNDEKGTFLTSRPLLNLHRSDMGAGTYICFAECNIRGETCRVKLLNISYQPPASGEQSGNVRVAIGLAAALVVVGAVAAIAIFFIRKRSKKSSETGGTPVTNGNGHASQQATPFLIVWEKGSANGRSTTESSNVHSVDIPDAKLGGLSKSERNRLAEEKALAKMRSNAARRVGDTNEAFLSDTDVAEGVAADKKKHE